MKIFFKRDILFTSFPISTELKSAEFEIRRLIEYDFRNNFKLPFTNAYDS